MEQHSQINDKRKFRAILEGQLRECFGRVVYTHKTHEKCADILLDRLSKIKLSQIILSAITIGGLIAAVLGAGNIGVFTSIVVSTILLVLNAYTKNYDLGEIAQKHRQAASDLWIVREKYISLITDLQMMGKPLAKLQAERDCLLEQLYSVYTGTPSTTFKGYNKAREALKKHEDMSFSDEEIDIFLPKELKRT